MVSLAFIKAYIQQESKAAAENPKTDWHGHGHWQSRPPQKKKEAVPAVISHVLVAFAYTLILRVSQTGTFQTVLHRISYQRWLRAASVDEQKGPVCSKKGFLPTACSVQAKKKKKRVLPGGCFHAQIVAWKSKSLLEAS